MPMPAVPSRIKKALERYVQEMPANTPVDDVSVMAFEKCAAAGFRPDLIEACEVFAVNVHRGRKRVPLGLGRGLRGLRARRCHCTTRYR